MRLRIGIGMARMNRLCHKSPLAASYIIYGNALALGNPSQVDSHAFDIKIRRPVLQDQTAIVHKGQSLPDGLLGGNLAASRRFRVYILESTNSLARARKRQTFPFSPRTSAPSNQHSRDSPRT